jgi:oxidase EvaA
MIVEVCPDNDIKVPDNYIWMTLRQMKEFMRHGMFNIEARSIISTINFVL